MGSNEHDHFIYHTKRHHSSKISSKTARVIKIIIKQIRVVLCITSPIKNSEVSPHYNSNSPPKRRHHHKSHHHDRRKHRNRRIRSFSLERDLDKYFEAYYQFPEKDNQIYPAFYDHNQVKQSHYHNYWYDYAPIYEEQLLRNYENYYRKQTHLHPNSLYPSPNDRYTTNKWSNESRRSSHSRRYSAPHNISYDSYSKHSRKPSDPDYSQPRYSGAQQNDFPSSRDKKFRFNETVQVLETYPPDYYDRRPIVSTQPTELDHIKSELNEFKMKEMMVHEDAKDNTQFHY